MTQITSTYSWKSPNNVAIANRRVWANKLPPGDPQQIKRAIAEYTGPIIKYPPGWAMGVRPEHMMPNNRAHGVSFSANIGN